jgi:hypothetical protein
MSALATIVKLALASGCKRTDLLTVFSTMKVRAALTK